VLESKVHIWLDYNLIRTPIIIIINIRLNISRHDSGVVWMT